MNKHVVDAELTEVLTVGTGPSAEWVGLHCATAHADKPTLTLTLPSSELPHLIARLSAAAARTAVLQAQHAGDAALARSIAEARHALPVTAASVEVKTLPGSAPTILVFAMTTDGAVIPLAVERPAAHALLSALAAALGH